MVGEGEKNYELEIKELIISVGSCHGVTVFVGYKLCECEADTTCRIPTALHNVIGYCFELQN